MSQISSDWRRSPYCDTNACVEAKKVGEDIALRDSKNPDGPVLVFSKSEWDAFVLGVNAGTFEF